VKVNSHGRSDASGHAVLNEDISRLSLDGTFGLDAGAFPLDHPLDLPGLRTAAARSGRLLLRAATPTADATALFAALVLTSNLTTLGLGWALLAFAGLLAAGSLNPRIDLRVARDAGHLATWVAIPLASELMLQPATRGWQPLFEQGAVAVLALLAGRWLSYGVIRAVRAHHLVLERTLIVGASPVSTQLATTLSEHAAYGLLPIGFLDARAVVSGASMSVLGDYQSLERVVRQFQVARVIIGFGRNLDLPRVIRTCQRLPVTTHLIARGAELGITPIGHHADDVLGIALHRVRRPRLTTPSAMLMKRALDVIAASLLLTLTAPIWLGAAAAVRLSSPGPIFFRQRRVGQGGRPFELLKFRTMRVNADSDTTWSVAHDHRVTPVGQVLRKTSVDELPQLVNVLRGDMSLIGPRPERPHFVERFGAEVPNYQDRHRAPVGITGWAQVNGLRGDTSIQDRVRLDNHYVEQWSPWFDLVILLRTAFEVLRGSSP
jgi:exopolysaccharide biosynthesis polyprenyl glycosylphosphotransferase